MPAGSKFAKRAKRLYATAAKKQLSVIPEEAEADPQPPRHGIGRGEGGHFAEEHSISGFGSVTETHQLPTPLRGLETPHSNSEVPTTPDVAHEPPHMDNNTSSSDKIPKPSQTTQLVDEFRKVLPTLLNDIFYAGCPQKGLNSLCDCKTGLRTVACFDCMTPSLLCPPCFIQHHRHTPLHWAHVWNMEGKFFVQHDLASIDPNFTIYLGHEGNICPVLVLSPELQSPVRVTIVDVNGIHLCRVAFCLCDGLPDRAKQLLRSGFFPATLKSPRTAFSFAVLKHFHMLQLESKTSTYDFCSTLRRLTDNVFTDNIMDIFPQFVIVMQVWRVCVAMMRVGYAHGIDAQLPHRRPKNLLLYCCACPEPHFNTDNDYESIPKPLRHLHQLQLTADGNHHANHYAKNSDPLNRSLFDGRAYFPPEDEYQQYLKGLPQRDAEKTTCNHLNAAEKQDRKKFKNMDITGIVNIQCSHVMIKASVDLQLGEKFTNTDMALYRALTHSRRLDVESDIQYKTFNDFLLSYDIACGYSRHLVERFANNFDNPSLANVVSKARPLIPAVHIQNHQDNCIYLYAAAYTKEAGHFHGETSEQYWPELNQFGPQLRQMNPGNRIDLIIDSHSDWNWKKTKQMFLMLQKELLDARDMYYQHRMRFISLCNLHLEKIVAWDKRDRDERRLEGKEVMCVYRQSSKNVPSQKGLLNALLAKRHGTNSDRGVDETEPETFINEGLSIQSSQHDLKTKISSHKDHPLGSLATEIEQDSAHLQKRLVSWRILQQQFMSATSLMVSEQDQKKPDVTEETLYLPSDLPATLRCQIDSDLVKIESDLREGIAFDTIVTIQQHVKTFEQLTIFQRTQCIGQDQNTRARAQILRTNSKRLHLISFYNVNRLAMIALKIPRASQSFPHLTFADTCRLPASVKRSLGDSRRFDGAAWTTTKFSSQTSPESRTSGPLTDNTESNHDGFEHGVGVDVDVSTQGGKKHPKRPSSRKEVVKLTQAEDQEKATDSTDQPSNRPRLSEPLASDQPQAKSVSLLDGWIWRLGMIGDMSVDEIQAWEDEGDSVHWFRAEAEMVRWREQWEIKLIEYIRTINSFEKLSEVWKELSANQIAVGAAAYARKRAAMYQQMARKAQDRFTLIQDTEPTRFVSGESVASYITRHRRVELANFHSHYTPHLLTSLT